MHALSRFKSLTRPLALALALAAPCAAALAQEFAPLAGFERVRGVTALAVDPTGARIALGTHSSVWLAARGDVAQRALRVGEVRDLGFAPSGALWVASERGVFELAGGVATPHTLGPGASGRATRLLWLGETLLVGSEDGLALRAPGGAFARIAGAAPSGEVHALAALGPHSALAIVGTEIARIELEAGSGAVRECVRELLPTGDGAALDLALLPSGAALALRESGLAQRDLSGGWQRVPLTLPPGALPGRLLSNARGLWLATSAGALFAQGPRGPFERAPAPAGSANVLALAASDRELLLAGPRGALQRELRTQLPAAREDARARVAASAPAEPSVLDVQRAAIRYLALEPGRVASLRRRPRLSALAPTLEISGGLAADSGRKWDWNQTFSSGADREFFDRHRERGHDYDAMARLGWNLGGAIYHPEEIDASKEARAWIELRDEVLDEVSQLYFERRRAQLDAAYESDPHVAARLALRAAELAAGLDAWTGGWWSARVGTASPERPASEITP